MPNCVISKPRSDTIDQILLNAIMIDRDGGIVDIYGSNGKRINVDTAKYIISWTEDFPDAVSNRGGIGWNRRISELNVTEEKIDLEDVDHDTLKTAIRHGRELLRSTYDEIELYIDANVQDPGTAKVLKFFGRVILSVVKIQWRLLRHAMR